MLLFAPPYFKGNSNKDHYRNVLDLNHSSGLSLVCVHACVFLWHSAHRWNVFIYFETCRCILVVKDMEVFSFHLLWPCASWAVVQWYWVIRLPLEKCC